MRNAFPLIIALFGVPSAIAQNWIVGVPAAFKWSELTLFGGCDPAPDQNITFSAPGVSGVEYVAIVDAVTPPGTNLIAPLGPGPLNVGDTVDLVVGPPNTVYFPSGSGSMSLSFWAIGTPTTAGQAHPCTFNALWLSNLMLCPEGLTKTVQATCVVQPGTVEVQEAQANDVLLLPSAANGWTLSAPGSHSGSALLLDATGQVIARKLPADLSGRPNGVYLLQVTRPDGTASVHRFVLSR